MTFVQSELVFEPGIFANRSRRASKRRWVDGDLVRFRDGVPAQVGGWLQTVPAGATIAGAARAILAWRPNDQVGRYAAIGTSDGAFLYDGDRIDPITPDGFVPGLGGTTVGDGFGGGRFGAGTFGTARVDTGNKLDASSWSFSMFGEVLLGCFTTDGRLYAFDVREDAKLVPIAGAPSARAIVVSDERHVFAFGADGIPGRVAWSDRENYSVWEPSATNRAGFYDLQVTSPFRVGAIARGRVLGWTGNEVFEFVPLNNALVYDREKIASGAGAVGPQAVVVTTDEEGDTAYWFGRDNFWLYDGYVRALECELHDYVFNDVNLDQAARFHTRLNSRFDEIWFWYCSKASAEINRAVVYNYKLGTWSKASVARLCWLDAGVFDKPLAVDASGKLFVHEEGTTANGAAMPSFIVSHPITVGVGQQFAEIDQFWPDMQEGSAPCAVSFVCRDAPGGESYIVGPAPFSIGDEIVPLNIATREFQLRIDGQAGHWELGLPLISMQGGSLR